MDKNKYNKFAKITGIFIGLVLVLGISYAVLRTTSLGEQNNTISAGKLDLRIDHEQDEIVLENSFPVTEKQALKQTPYTFDVVNKGTIEAEYDLYMEIDENVSTLSPEVVRYYLTVEEDGREKIITSTGRLLSKEEKIEKDGKSLYHLDIKYIKPEKINKYKLYLWIDYDATLEQANNKTFEAKVRVEAEQIYQENKLVKVVDVSASGDNSVKASFYANGVIIVRGEGTIQPGLSDTLKFENEALVENYKKVFTFMGYDVSNLNTMEELENYINEIAANDPDFDTNVENALQVVVIKEVLEEMGHDSSRVTDIDTAIAYVIELGYCDAEGNPTEQGEAFFARFEEKINNDFSGEPIPPKKIILEDGITNIPDGLFSYNENITEVIIPASVTSIDNNAFEGCRNLTEINIPDSVITIGNAAFSGCTNLTEINIPKGITKIGNSVFFSCTNLTKINLPDALTNIGNNAFSWCNGLTTINLPKSLISLGKNAFQNCSNLEYISLPNGITEINEYTFWNCTKLSKIDMPDGVTRIGVNAFSWAALTELTLPQSLITLDRNAFSGCRNLKSVTLPNTLTTIGNNVFSDCTSLTEITIPNSVTSIGNEAFMATGLTEVTIPETITSIGTNAFKNCTKLESVTVPVSVTAANLFSGTTSIKELNLTGEGVMRDYDASTYNTTPWYDTNSTLEKLTINEGITSIGDYAFRNFSNIKELIIPKGVTSVGDYSFGNCSRVTKLYVDASLNIAYLPSWKGRHPFADMKNIKELFITGKGDMLDEYLFSSVEYSTWSASRDSIEKIVIEEGITSIGGSAFTLFTNLKEIIIPDSVREIKQHAFNQCAIPEITIPNSVVSVGPWAFGYWKEGQKINIDNTEDFVLNNWNRDWNYNSTQTQVNYLRS